MFWRLLPHATICIASDRLILLDSRQDRYLMMPDEIASSVGLWLTASPTTAAPGSLVNLLQAGGALRDTDPRPTNAERFKVTIPATLAGDVPGLPEASTAQIGAIMMTVIGTWIALRARGFDLTLRRLAYQSIFDNTAQTVAALTRIAAYDRARRYVPLPRNCLLDSLAQFRWLARAGIGCRMVFGVTGHPFAAHCWLQSRDAILNDTYEHVSRFTPIMVL